VDNIPQNSPADRLTDNNPSSCDFFRGRLELGLYQSHHPPSPRKEEGNLRQDLAKGDKGKISHNTSDAFGWNPGSGMANIDGLEKCHTRIRAKAGVEKPLPNINGKNGGRARLQQAIGKPSGRRPEIREPEALNRRRKKSKRAS
jgi:hypothetical protein